MKISSLTLAAIMASALATGAMAQDKAGGGLGVVCKAELASLCAGGKAGPFVCLTQNQAKLGAECATYVKAAEERRTKFRAACEADRTKLCKDVEAKGGKQVQCLRDKQAELSKPCADALAALPAPAKK